MSQIDPDAQEVLKFWFEDCDEEQWFKKDPDFDARIAERFSNSIAFGLAGHLSTWEGEDRGRLALILVLDQFTRNVFRDTPRAFSGDHIALRLSQEAVASGAVDRQSEKFRRIFTLMPMMHSEDLLVQEAALPLFERHTNERTLKYALAHRDIVARFGRFPHRNAILGRESTKEETAFLKEPGSSF
ncbi:MAG: DUF924 family protein [Pseudomonadota bacterium]